MTQHARFEQAGVSSNLTWYRPLGGPREDGLFVEVCSVDFERITVDGQRTLRPKRPSTYNLTVTWWPDGGPRSRQVRFQYAPARTATGGRLAASTVTRLVRERFPEGF